MKVKMKMKMQNAKCKMQNAKCKMQNAKCKMQNAKCKMQNETEIECSRAESRGGKCSQVPTTGKEAIRSTRS
jgi:hypothetical protein